jgi:hypothetical protein
MDWITLTRKEVEEDALPEVCMVCGSPADRRRNETFAWHPTWVSWLYWLGYLPGVIWRDDHSQWMMALAIPLAVLGLLIWLGMAIAAGLRASPIYAQEISADGIHLVGLADGFVTAVREQRTRQSAANAREREFRPQNLDLERIEEHEP